MEPIQTEPRSFNPEQWSEYGLTPDGCIPVGRYEGILRRQEFNHDRTIMMVAGEHHFSIQASCHSRTKDIRVASHVVRFIDWRAVTALS
ncbi:MAG: hypothetical protein QOG91_65 [Candidatus Parcubacteria bacterium]|jgi:hypothetical protein|nr:hypothetical protein [Candidatus Parcubacteria bacterium]